MTQNIVNIGETPNDRNADSIRTAFNKINANFTELYTQLGLVSDPTLNLGAFEFNGSTLTTNDSSDITIAQNVHITSNLTMSGDIVPLADNIYDLGSPTHQWRSLYVSGNTVYLGGVPLSLEAGTNELKVNNVPISQTITYADIPNVPTDVSDLTDTQGLLGGGGGAANTGDIIFVATTISAPNEDEIVIESKDSNGFGTARVTLNSLYGGNARLEAFSNESVDTFTLANGDFTTGVWQDNGFGNGVVAFTGAQNIGDFFQNTLFNLTADNVSIVINSEPAFIWNGGASGAGTDTPGFGTNPIVPATPITITSIQFRYRSESYISVNYDNQEIRLNAQNAGIRMDSGNNFEVYSDSRIELQSTEGMSLSAGQDLDISTSSSFAVRISTGDITLSAFDDVRIEGTDSFRLINSSATAPIRIITNDDATPRTWAFNPDGTVTFPDATVQTTAYTGPQTSLTGDVKGSVFADDSTLLVDAVSGSIPYAVLSGAPTIPADISDLTDTTNLLGSGTGDITFDGVKIQGAGTASGDGNGYSTIELVPDTDLYANDQYLVIDPTEPAHIHIRAGGTQDASSASLYLGGEKNNVRVIDGTGVRLYNEVRNDTVNSFSDPTDFNTATWYGTPGNYFVQFTQVTAGMGDLAFQFGNDAENRVTVSYGVGESSVLTYGGSASNLGGGVYRFAVVEAPPASPTVLTAIEFQIWTTNNNRIELQNNDFTVSVEDDIRITGNDIFSLRNRSRDEDIEIHTDYDNSDHTWRFEFDGTFSTPGDIVVNGDVTGTAGGSTLVLRAEPGSNTAIQLNDIVDSEIRTAANFEIRTDVNNTPNVWTFGTDSSLTFPDSTVQTTAWTGVADIAQNIESEDAVEIKVNLTDSTTHTWRFGEDGHLNLPSGGGNIQSDGTIQLITGSSTFTVTDDVFGFLNNKNGTIALSLVSGGVSITGSGNFAFSGNAFAATTSNNINFTSGSGITLNSPVTEVRGNDLILVGNAVDIQSEGGVNIDVNLSDSTLRRWHFGEDGILNLPEGGDIVDSTGTSVLGGGGGGSVLEEPFESKSSATGVIEHDATTNRLFRHTSISANFTANFTNLGLTAGKATSISLVLVQGATARMCTAVQIGGAAQTITWQGSASAPLGNANRTDVVTFSILCTATDTYTVLGMLTSFGG